MDTVDTELRSSFLLRIEAVNLDRFIQDTDDLSTIRGAGLLLLNAGRLLHEDDGGNPTRRPLLTKRGNDDSKYTVRVGDGTETSTLELQLVSRGASILLFRLEATQVEASMLRNAVAEALRTHSQLRHATFVVELTAFTDEGDGFSRAVVRSETRTRLAQMRSPNVSFGPIVVKRDSKIRDGFCDIDGRRARRVDLNKEPRHEEGSSYSSATDKNLASLATHERRKYGRSTKKSVYQMVANEQVELRPAWEFEQIARRGTWRTSDDLQTYGEDDPFESAANKIGVIYIDGNKFGKLLNSAATPQNYEGIDRVLRTKRRDLMRQLVDRISKEPRWRVWPRDEKGNRLRAKDDGQRLEKTRIETLLWGGDELIWVVPGWCALEVIRFFFGHTRSWDVDRKKLTHAVGLVLCAYNAPIRAVVTLARELAEDVKQNLQRLYRRNQPADGVDPKKNDYKHEPTSNALAYEVLESFDHLGRDYGEARKDLRLPQMTDVDAILTAAELDTLLEQLARLKHGTDKMPKLPSSRLHQILQTLRRAGSAAEDDQPAWKCRLKKILERIAKTGDEKADFSALDEPLFRSGEQSLPAKWFHLMELWSYGGFEPAHHERGVALQSKTLQKKP